jgi:16S rRNA (cytosine967-C5)-methyltransferase
LHPHRAKLLAERVAYCANVTVLTGDAAQLDAVLAPEERFDLILADVPCSGTGTLARNPEIKWKLTAADLVDLQRRQSGILRSALKVLAPGGRLVYSTCSLEAEENEQVVEKILAEQNGAAGEGTAALRVLDCGAELRQLDDFLPAADIDSYLSGPYLRTLPGVHPCEGFFAAVLVKG